jgi:UDP-N-acetylmuramoyl-tripeptide--D-alanyl-D-alanine ligase
MATMTWDGKKLTDWAQGKWLSDLNPSLVKVQGFSTDSRRIQKNEAYIAIQGQHFDGHAFVEQAIEAGAQLLIVSQKQDVAIPQILVKDTRLALGQIAEQHRLAQDNLTLIAVTGSNGKTTVKTLLAHCLSQVAPTWATPGNLNNDFGVPRTLLQIEPDHRYAVIEMGANHRGEIGYLTRLAHPNMALITLAADAHLEGFGSLQGVIDTKGEIFHGLTPQGLGLINTDSPGFMQWQQSLANKHCQTFGTAEEADVRVTQVSQDAQSLAFRLEFEYQGAHQALSINMAILGQHNAMNAAAVASVCLALGLTPQQIQAGLESFSGVAGRLQTHQQGRVTLINDSYNANPGSVKAAIDTLASLPGKRILCLGDMAELGAVASQAHAEIGEYAAQQGIDELYAYGELSAHTLNAFTQSQSRPARQPLSHSELAEQLMSEVLNAQQACYVLIKGSRSARMEQVVNLLLERMAHADLS